MPVEVIVRVQLRFFPGRCIPGAIGEAQIIADLQGEVRSKKNMKLETFTDRDVINV